MASSLASLLASPELLAGSVGGLEVLTRDFSQRRREWAIQAFQALTHLKAALHSVEESLNNSAGELKITRDRLKSYKSALEAQLPRLEAELQPFMQVFSGKPDLLSAISVEASVPQIFEDLPNLFRDWCWGRNENKAFLSRFIELLSPVQKMSQAKVFMPGAGTGGLAYELARALNPELMVASDINPLLLSLAQKLSRGQELDLWEFPSLPLNLSSYAIRRELRAGDGPAPSALKFVLHDFTEPVFCAGAFDVVVTAWFIDILPQDPRATFASVHSLLKPGGVWVNLGPLMYRTRNFAGFLSYEETLAHVEKCGFTVEDPRLQAAVHLASPVNAGERRLQLTSFRAIRDTSEAVAESPKGSWQQFAWLENPNLPVSFPGDAKNFALGQVLRARVVGEAATGRSIAEISQDLADRSKIPLSEAQELVTELLRQAAQTLNQNPFR